MQVGHSDSVLAYELRRLRGLEASSTVGVVPNLRRWYWRFVRRHALEICERCGRPVEHSTGPTWWEAPDWLWERVNGGPNGVLCMPCFAEGCCDAGYLLHWYAAPPGDGF